MRKIAIEEHFTTEEHLDCLTAVIEGKYPIKDVIQEEKILHYELPFLFPTRREEAVKRLLDLGESRVKQMDEAGIDVQVLSLVSPGVQVFDAPKGTALAKKINDRLFEAVSQYPERLAGFASLAPQDPEEAAAELERTVKDLGFKGASINSHTKGEYLDEKKYWVIFEKAEKLGVPIYIHPRSPSPDMVKPFLDYPMLSTAMMGFAAEVSLHALRLISSGLFDQFPRLNIILGHLGEALPYWLWRLDNIYLRVPVAEKLNKAPSEYFKDHFFVTTSGMFWEPPLLCSQLALGTEKILFAVDYPLESNEVAVQFMEDVTLSEGDKEKIYHLNAEELLRL